MNLHPQEALLQEARAFQRSEGFAPYRRLRQAAEHRIARLMQLGMRQARYFGRAKTLGQLILAAAVANLTLVARRVGLMRGQGRESHRPRVAPLMPILALLAWLGTILARLANADHLAGHSVMGFRPDF